MTSTNISFIDQAVAKFQNLDANDRLTVLHLIYCEVNDEVPPLALDEAQHEGGSNLVAKIQELPKTEQLSALHSLVQPKGSDQNKSGEATISTDDYHSMSAEHKLGFWYQLGKNLGSSIIDVPSDYIPSEKATEVVDLLETTSMNDFVSFLKQVL
jgi:Orange carotenoid protein, N-terminal